MIFSSPFSRPSLAIPKPNQHTKSSPPSPLQSNRCLPISSATRTSAKMASSTLPSSTLPPSSLTAKSSSLYEVLGVPMAATPEEIKAAYRKLARVCHPDVAAKDAPADEFMMIQTAYSTLSDPEKRADYDHRVVRRFTTIRTAPSGTRGPVYSRRKWETDQCW